MFHPRRYFQRKTPQTYKPVILVTGCSSGIGAATAKLLFSQSEYRVVVTARQSSMERLRNRYKENERFWVRALDVTSAKDRQALVDEIVKTWGGVDILVNNAGISYRAVVEHMSEED